MKARFLTVFVLVASIVLPTLGMRAGDAALAGRCPQVG